MIDITLDRVSKQYKLRTPGKSPKRWYSDVFRRRSTPMWALRDVSFQVRQGEALGIVGHNGAGKTTILKILSSITTPTAGEITVRGRMAALVEVGSGFHPELTGRENIQLARRNAGDEKVGNTPEAGQYYRIFRRRPIHRCTRKTLFFRNVCAFGFLHCRTPGSRHSVAG